MSEHIRAAVHEAYWERDVNCAGTMLHILAGLHDVVLQEQVLYAAVGMHGAGGFRAQCGLVEGALMFLGIYGRLCGKTAEETAALCYDFAARFTERFGSLSCRELRPGGFSPEDPPHLCEALSVAAVEFAARYVETSINTVTGS